MQVGIFYIDANSLLCTSQLCEGAVRYERFEVRPMGRICTSLTVVMIVEEIVQIRKTIFNIETIQSCPVLSRMLMVLLSF